MSATELNAFLRSVAADPARQRRLAGSDALAAAQMAQADGFDVVVADLIRYQARSTTWELRDDELAVVERWQPHDQPYWWQGIWPQ